MSTNKTTRVSIAILTFNRAPLLRKLLDSLVSLPADEVEILVVDNNSHDETPQVVGAFGDRCRLFRTERNIGVGARNIGLREASADIVVCLDDDVFGIDQDALRVIRDAFDEDPSLGALNFKVVNPVTGAVCNWVHHCRPDRYADQIFETYEITEGAVAFRRAAVAAAGYYPDHFFLGHEGPDLAFRLIESGYRVFYRGAVVVRHWHASTGRLSWMTYYYESRNQYWLAARNFPLFYGLRYLVRGQLSTCVYSIRDGFFLHWLRAARDGVFGVQVEWAQRRVVTTRTLNVIRQVHARRPSFFYLVRKRLFQREIRQLP
jgi:GT2 family glycosyltransferase